MVVLTSFTQPTDGIRHRQPNTTVYVNDNNLGKGTVYIAESALSWISDSGGGFSLEYPHISLHAISRDLNAFPQECLFLMLDTALGDEEINENGEDDDDNENGSVDQGTTELKLVPDDKGMLDAMFHEMNACQALHPDPEDSFSDEDFYEDADDEIPVEETDSRMAGLRIGSMDERGRMALGRVAGMGVGMEAGRVLGRQDRMEFGGVGGREEADYIQADMGEGRVGGMVEDREEDMEVGRVGGISAYRRDDMAQDGRSFFGDNTWPQSRMEHSPPSHEAHTDPEDSNFDDVEY